MLYNQQKRMTVILNSVALEQLHNVSVLDGAGGFLELIWSYLYA